MSHHSCGWVRLGCSGMWAGESIPAFVPGRFDTPAHDCGLCNLASKRAYFAARDCRVGIIAGHLLDHLPGADIVLLGLLPRGKSSLAQPSVFTAAINALNEKLRRVAAESLGGDMFVKRTWLCSQYLVPINPCTSCHAAQFGTEQPLNFQLRAPLLQGAGGHQQQAALCGLRWPSTPHCQRQP